MSVIEINHITKDYGNHKGVFDVSFEVEKGEVLGFLGPNGSGKTTTIRQLMGFMKPDQGEVNILGMNCFEDAKQVQSQLGYLPGEIAFMEDMTGLEFIRFMGQMKNMKDTPILILDEPTSGLDPLMQNKFIDLIRKAKQEGKTILMSSHIFEEVENTCDRVVMIKEGQIVATETMENLRKNRMKHYEIHFYDEMEAQDFITRYPQAHKNMKVVSLMLKGHTNQLLQDLSQYDIDDFNARPQSLEELFLHYYGGAK